MSAKLSEFLLKLGHPLSDVKLRSAKTLFHKLQIGLCEIRDLLEDSNFLPNIVSLLRHKSIDLIVCGLDLLSFVVKDVSGAASFESIGGRFILDDLRKKIPSQYEEKVLSIQQSLIASPISISSSSYDGFAAHVDENKCTSYSDSNLRLSSISERDIHTATIEDSCINDKSSIEIRSPVILSAFPWVPLTTIDARVLQFYTDTIVACDESELISLLQDWQTSILGDFPVEVFLQRPLLLKSLWLRLKPYHETNDLGAWRMQERVCDALHLFANRLFIKMKNHHDISDSEKNGNLSPSNDNLEGKLSKCCTYPMWGEQLDSEIASNQELVLESIHEEDDKAEFETLHKRQLSIIEWCCQTITICFQLLEDRRPRLSRAIFRVVQSTMSILRSCISPEDLWRIVDANLYSSMFPEAQPLVSSFMQHLKVLSNLICRTLKATNVEKSESEVESNSLQVRLLVQALLLWIDYFAPSHHIGIVFGKSEIDALGCLLSNACFYLDCPEEHSKLLSNLRLLDSQIAKEIDSLAELGRLLLNTKQFLEISSITDFDDFLNKASSCLPLIFVHKSRTYVEKILQGFSKYSSMLLINSFQELSCRKILLQILSIPDKVVRILCYTIIKELIVKSVGVSQACNTTMERSYDILFLIHPSIICHFIYSGCCDEEIQVRETCRSCLLTLIYGLDLMAEEVLRRVTVCFCQCLLDLNNLVDSTTHLGKAIFDLPFVLSKKIAETHDMNEYCVKFYLKCLLSRDLTVRLDAIKNCFAFLITSSTEYVSVASSLPNCEKRADMFTFNPSVNILAAYPVNAMDRANLNRVLNLLSRPSIGDKEGTEAAWSQLTFLLRNPSLTEDLDDLWPVLDTVEAFKTMMKTSGGPGLDVSLVPLALEVLFLRASYSSRSRKVLSRSDSDFFLLLLRASLFFISDNSVQLEVSLLLSLTLNEDVLHQQTDLNMKGISLPLLVSKSQFVAFKHTTYSWKSDQIDVSICKKLFRTDDYLNSSNGILSARSMNFLKIFWSGICATDFKQLLKYFDFASSFSPAFSLSRMDAATLRSGLSLSHAGMLIENIENATSHRPVKESLYSLQSLLPSIADTQKLKIVLQTLPWDSALNRFFLSFPATASDRQIVYHVLNTFCMILKLIEERLPDHEECIRCSTVYLLKEEFEKPESSLSKLLLDAGCSDSQLPNNTAQSLQSVLLFNSITSVVLSLTNFSSFYRCSCHSSANWNDFGCNLSSLLVAVVRKCHSVQDFNLCILVPTLDCLISLGQKRLLQNGTSRLVSLTVDLIMSFHVGRGRAHNTYIGTAVSSRCCVLLALCIGLNNGDVSELTKDGNTFLPWLLGALEHCDKGIMTSALKVLIALANSDGVRLLDGTFERISGGVWALMLRYFTGKNVDVLVKLLSVCVLVNLSSLSLQLPKTDKPWCSLCIVDSVTGVMVRGRSALFDVLNLFDFLRHVCRLLKLMTFDLQEIPVYEQSGIPALDEFVCSERTTWLSSADLEDDSDFLICTEQHIQLLQMSIQLTVNFWLVNPTSCNSLISSSGLGKVMVRHLSFLTDFIKTCDKWNSTIEVIFCLLRLLGPPFSCNTQIAALAVNVFCAEYSAGDSFKEQSLGLLCCILSEGGWGAVHVLELIRASSSAIVGMLVGFLHESSTFVKMASTFIGVLCGATVNPSVPENYTLSLHSLLDSSILLPGRECGSCPGWELARHLIQLLPSKLESSLSLDYSSEAAQSSRNLKVILEALKLLLMVSKTARDCAFYNTGNLLPLMIFSLANLNGKIRDINIHINFNIMSKKELRSDILFTIHVLQVATNWMADSMPDQRKSTNSDASDTVWSIGASILPEIHPLWIPSLRAHPLLDSIIQFLIAVSFHSHACCILTRTTVVPGAELSRSRTKNSLLSAICSNVIQHLSRTKKSQPAGRCSNDCRMLPERFLNDSLDLVTNCSLNQECAFVIVKEDFTTNLITYVNQSKDLNSVCVQKLIRCLAVLTIHKEGRSALLKVPSWAKCILRCCGNLGLCKNSLLIFVNMTVHTPATKNILSKEDFLPSIFGILEARSRSITNGINSQNEHDVHTCLILVWSLASNNERCKASLRKFGLRPILHQFLEQNLHQPLSKMLLDIV